MEERVSKLEVKVEHLEKNHDDMDEKVEKHGKSCDIHAPMAKQAHDATAEMGAMISDLNTKVNLLISRNDKKDEDDDLWKNKILNAVQGLVEKESTRAIAEAEARGAQREIDKRKSRRRTFLFTFSAILTPFIIGFLVWITTSIQELKADNRRNEPSEHKAIHKSMKPVKKAEDEEDK